MQGYPTLVEANAVAERLRLRGYICRVDVRFGIYVVLSSIDPSPDLPPPVLGITR